jgi:hypothetical protein
VLFLDIDGVLCLDRIKLPKDLKFDETSISNLKMFLNETKPKIILSSTWRYKKEKLDRVNEFFKTFEIDKISDVTPTIQRNKRDEEIVQWLESHSNPKVWIAFDGNSFKLILR